MKMKNKKRESDEEIIQRFCHSENIMDDSSIQELKKKAGVSIEYLKECEKIHGKNLPYTSKNK